MYSTEQLKKTFLDTVAFFKLPVELAKIETVADDHYIFYIQEKKERVNPSMLQEELSKTLRVTVEIRFLGARETAQEIGGCGPCGRQLCCASWLKNIPPVKSDALKGQKYSDTGDYLGMCGKLRCCLAYLIDDFKLPKTQFQDQLSPQKDKRDPQRKKLHKKMSVPSKKRKHKFTRTLTLKPKRNKKS